MQQTRAERPQDFSVVCTPETCIHCGQEIGARRRECICPVCTQSRLKPGVGAQQLSCRETQVVALVRQAKANKEIAYELCLTEGTVKEYLYRIYRKLQVRNRTELALRGLDQSIAGQGHARLW